MSHCLKYITRGLSFTPLVKRTFSQSSKQNPGRQIGKTSFQSLRGRDLLSFEGYTRNDIFSLLWIATELRSGNVPASALSEFRYTKIGLIWSSPIVKASVSHASQQLNASLCSFHEEQLDKSIKDFKMLGRCLASTADIMFLDAPSWSQSNIEEFALGSNTPVIVIASKEFSYALAYAELLTLFLKYGYLRRLVIASIGPGNNPMLNTYFTLLPTVGIHLKYLVDNNQIDNQNAWEAGLQLSSRLNTELKQVESLDEALYRAHAISTCFHNSPLTNLTLKNVQEMDLDWSFLQYDSFKGFCASDEILKARGHCLIYDAIINQMWIFQALIVGHTSDFSPIQPPPQFEGVD